MSSKFGLIDDPDDVVERSEGKIDLSGFAPVQKRSPIDLAEVDAAAADSGMGDLRGVGAGGFLLHPEEGRARLGGRPRRPLAHVGERKLRQGCRSR